MGPCVRRGVWEQNTERTSTEEEREEKHTQRSY